MNDSLFTEPGPLDRLLEALDPQGEHDLGLAVLVAAQLDSDAQTVLGGLIERRLARVLANLVLAEHLTEIAAQPGRPRIADTLALVDRIRAIAIDRTLTNDDIARGIRDALREHDGEDFGDDA